MKRLLLILPLMIVVFSCATIDINSFLLSEPTSQYKEILVLFSNAEEEFYEWNEENYHYTIMGRVNNLDQSRFRQRFMKELQTQLAPTKFQSVESFFPLQKVIQFDEFMSRIEDTNIEAILLVNTRGFWNNELVLDGDVYLQPNAEYHCFLIDKNALENVWMAKVGTYGHSLNTHAGLQNRFISQLGKELYSKNLIAKPRFSN